MPDGRRYPRQVRGGDGAWRCGGISERVEKAQRRAQHCPQQGGQWVEKDIPDHPWQPSSAQFDMLEAEQQVKGSQQIDQFIDVHLGVDVSDAF